MIKSNKQSKQSKRTKSVPSKKSTPVTEPLASSGEEAVSAPATAPTPVAAEPLEARVESATALSKQVIAVLGITAAPLAAAQAKAATKFRKGGDPFITTLADLSTEYGVEVPSRPTSDMASNLAMAQVLGSFLLLVTRLQNVVTSEAFGYRSATWATATTLYQMLKKASVRQTALKADLEPIEEFFAFRRRKPAEPATPSPTTENAVTSDLPEPAPAGTVSTPLAAIVPPGAPSTAPAHS